MKKILILLTIAIGSTALWGQSAATYGRGSQLIPLDKTDVTLQKEILTFTQTNGLLGMDTYYEFFNPGEEQSVMIAFETDATGGAAEAPEYSPNNPLVHDLKIEMNGSPVSCSVSIVPSENYYKDGVFQILSKDEIESQNEQFIDEWEVDYIYVYAFRVTFKKGLNVIKHSYSLGWSYDDTPQSFFLYSLRGAGHWANRQIDDFTWRVDFGERAFFRVENALPDAGKLLRISGLGKSQVKETWREGEEITEFFIKKGMLEYRAQNLNPQLTLCITRPKTYFSSFSYLDDSSLDPITYQFDEYMEVEDAVSKKVLRNLPFAIRGYVFKDPILREYYSGQYWYMPDATYKADVSTLSEEERKWVMSW